ncbi:lipase family protein [Gordonia sp. OPL2]|uniref:lipase family protein n=1 Tax=Gordonia sp. OPL2 TaxID=2486274 RepID=UPI0016562A98|nr:lipase family protein [Gordonia sp. OPL2]RPA06279.1 triacylglycerol lipase [Gordonia sp. OPL2]
MPGSAGANPAFPHSFPPHQNQLPQLPREPDIYRALPIATPDTDPWYRDPPNIGAYRPGQIVRTRVVQTRILGIPFPVHTKQLLYRSEDAHGRPIVTATSVIIPGTPWTGSPRPVVSFQEAIDSTSSACNPSHTLQTGTFKEATLATSWLAQGFAVNVPDFDGKFNTFSTWDEGKMVLDSLRAVKNDTTLGLRRSGFALYGYSGGGSGSIRAAGLRKTYAPDVTILGTAMGGAPADLTAQARYATGAQPGVTGISNFTMWLGFAALSREYPEIFDAKRLLTPAGQKIVADLGDRCVYTAAMTGMWRPIRDYFQPGKTLEKAPGVMPLLRDLSLDKHIPDTPVLWFHGIWDELIPPSTVVLPVVRKYWQAGADLRFVTIPLPEHVTNAAVGWMPAQAWISAVLRGASPGPRFKLDYPAPLPKGFPGT